MKSNASAAPPCLVAALALFLTGFVRQAVCTEVVILKHQFKDSRDGADENHTPLCPGAPGCERLELLANAGKLRGKHEAQVQWGPSNLFDMLQENIWHLCDSTFAMLVSIWQSLLASLHQKLSLSGDNDISVDPRVGPDLQQTRLGQRRQAHRSQNLEKAEEPYGQSNPTTAMKSRVLVASLFMVVFVYIVAWCTLLYNRAHPDPELARAYITLEKSEHVEEDMDTDEEQEIEKKLEADNQMSKQMSTGPALRRTSAPALIQSNIMPPTPMSAGSMGSPRSVLVKQRSLYSHTGHINVDGEDLVNEIGLSAMCCFDADQPSSVTRLSNKVAVPLIALQCAALQVGLLYFMLSQLKPAHDETRQLPISIVFIAIYLHFLNCVQELPYSYQLFSHIHDFHEKISDLAILGTVLITDAFVIPLLSFVLGALYLCTSRTIGDAILNAVAVAFIREIDNWILSLNNHTDVLSGKRCFPTLHIPVNTEFMRQIAWNIIFLPLVPICSTCGMIYIGFYQLGLAKW